jgi:SnoaL-like domain
MHASALEQDIRAALMEHWAASDANDFSTEHQIYCDDAILDYPQSGERIRGRANIQASRTLQPSKKRFEVRRILGSGGLWITEYIIYYDEKPFYTVSIMEFRDGKIAHETAIFQRTVCSKCLAIPLCRTDWSAVHPHRKDIRCGYN